MAPRFSVFFYRLRSKVSSGSPFQFFLLVLAMLAFSQLQVSGQVINAAAASAAAVAPAAASPIVSRGPNELKLLLPLETPPAIEISPEAGPVTLKTKIPQKYNVSLIGQRRVDTGVNFYSLDQEMAMGTEMSQELEARSKMLNDPAVTQYVNEIGQRLAGRSDIKEPLIIKVVDSDEVNAYALPGGYFYVNTGLILAAQSESELAAVMSHEIAHIAARHATRNMTKVQIWNLLSIPMMFVGGPVGMAVREVSSLAMPMSINKFSRDAEREADLLGIEYEYAAGYDPNAFVEFFERIKSSGKDKQNIVAKAFATHPMNQERIRKAQKEIETMLPARDDYVVDTSEFHQIQGRLMGKLNMKPAFGTKTGNGPVLRRPNEGGQSPTTTSDSDKPDSDKPELKRR